MPQINILRCKYCGKHQGTQSKKALQCKYCGRQTGLKKGLYSRVLKIVYDGREAQRIIMEMNEK